MFLEVAVFRLSFLTLFVQVAYYLLFRARYGRRAWFRAGRLAFLGLAVFTQGHLWYYVIAGRDLWPHGTQGIQFIFYMLSMAWLLTLICLTPFALWIAARRLAPRLTRFITRFMTRSRGGKKERQASAESGAGTLARGDFLKRGADALTVMAPALGMTAISSGLFLGSREIIVNRHPMGLPANHDDLKGLRLVQISDIHVGSLIDERYLSYCAGILAGLRADVLVVTGDIIDLNNHHAPIAGRFFRALEKHFPLGIYGVAGNHEFFDDGPAFLRMMQGGALRFLRNEEVIIRRGRGRLRLMGLEYPWPYRRTARRRMAREFFKRALHLAPRGEVPTRIVLNHHPSDFAWLRAEAVDLVLSGHTHGGQVSLTHARESLLSPISLMYPYYDGIYREEGSVLHVNRGLGHSIPLRINRPPEISLFELT